MIEAGPLTLRPWGPSDASFLFHARQDPDVARWSSGPRPFRAADAAAFVRAHARSQPEPHGAWLAVALTDTGELVGSVSIVPLDGLSGVGLDAWVAHEARGQRFGRTALRATARWAAATFTPDVVLLVAESNLVGQAVARNAGFVPGPRREEGACDGGRPVDAVEFRWSR